MKAKNVNGVLTNIFIWDYSGQDRFRRLAYEKMKMAGLLIVAYDCTDRSTFEDIPAQLKIITEAVGKDFKNKSILISTKCDVDQERKKVTEEEARILQKKEGFLDYF